MDEQGGEKERIAAFHFNRDKLALSELAAEVTVAVNEIGFE
jgi:hypothetical protein